MPSFYTVEIVDSEDYFVLTEPDAGIDWVQYGDGAEGGMIIAVGDLNKARELVASGKFKWYGPAPS